MPVAPRAPLRPGIVGRAADSTGVLALQHIARTLRGRCAPINWRCRQRFGRPARHRSQVPQAISGLNVIRVPTAAISPVANVSPAPCTTSPAHSCPMMRGGTRRLFWPRNPLSSEPQMPVAATEISTSPGASWGIGSARSTISRGPSHTRACIVRLFIGYPRVCLVSSSSAQRLRLCSIGSGGHGPS
jgi:hypothetical protein